MNDLLEQPNALDEYKAVEMSVLEKVQTALHLKDAKVKSAELLKADLEREKAELEFGLALLEQGGID
jgi:hypothetical protein